MWIAEKERTFLTVAGRRKGVGADSVDRTSAGGMNSCTCFGPSGVRCPWEGPWGGGSTPGDQCRQKMEVKKEVSDSCLF